VLEGGRHILAEVIAESADVRSAVRNVLWDTGKLCTSKSDKLAEGQGLEYKDYFQFTEPIRHIPPHRILAINRGEKENALQIKLEWDAETGLRVALERLPLPAPGSSPPWPTAAVAPPAPGEAPPPEVAMPPAEAAPQTETSPAPTAEASPPAAETPAPAAEAPAPQPEPAPVPPAPRMAI